jgi:hypothetical protein
MCAARGKTRTRAPARSGNFSPQSAELLTHNIGFPQFHTIHPQKSRCFPQIAFLSSASFPLWTQEIVDALFFHTGKDIYPHLIPDYTMLKIPRARGYFKVNILRAMIHPAKIPHASQLGGKLFRVRRLLFLILCFRAPL